MKGIFSLVKRINTDGDVFTVTEAKTKESQLAMILGISLWHVCKVIKGTWETR